MPGALAEIEGALRSAAPGPVGIVIRLSEIGEAGWVGDLHAQSHRLLWFYLAESPADLAAAASLPWPSTQVISPLEFRLTSTELREVVGRQGLPPDGARARALRTLSSGIPLLVAALSDPYLGDGGDQIDASQAAAILDRWLERRENATFAKRVRDFMREHIDVFCIVDAFDANLAHVLLGYETSSSWLRYLDEAGFIESVGVGSTDDFRVTPVIREFALRSGPLRADAAARDAIVLKTADALVQTGQTERALTLVSVLARWVLPQFVAEHWQDLGAVSYEQLNQVFGGNVAGPLMHWRLALARARAYLDVTLPGHPARISEAQCSEAERLLDLVDLNEATDAECALVAALRGVVARLRGSFDQALAAQREAMERLPKDASGELRGTVYAQLAFTHLEIGEYVATHEMLQRASAAAQGTPLSVFAAHSAALVDGVLGADAIVSVDAGAEADWRGGWQRVGWYRRASRLVSLARPHEAASALRETFGMLGAEGDWDPLVMGVFWSNLESLIAVLTESWSAGLAALEVFQLGLRNRVLSPFGEGVLTAARAELLVGGGEAIEARRELDRSGPRSPLAGVVRARALLSLSRFAEAEQLLLRMLQHPDGARSRQRTWILVQLSLATEGLGRMADSDQYLMRALAHATRTSFVLPFARQGPDVMRRLIERADSHSLDPGIAAFTSLLKQTHSGRLREPALTDITARERSVLNALATGQSIHEIAASSFVSPNTVKSQVRSIYQKLGAHNRREALEIGRSLGLLQSD